MNPTTESTLANYRQGTEPARPRVDVSTAELAQTRLTVRKDLLFHRRRLGRRDCYLIEDPASGNFHQIGLEEYTLVSVLDGTRTLADAVRLTTVALGNQALSEDEVAALGRWLIESELAYTAQAISASRLQKKHDRRKQAEMTQALNPITLRLNLGRPDRTVAWLSQRLFWLWSWPLAAIWLAVVLTAGLSLLEQWDRWAAGIPRIAYPSQWLYLLLSWTVLKACHELGHALTCKRFGGEVRQWGIMWMLFVPLPFVDVTSAWRFESKWERILVSLAGMMVELFVAAIAALVWCHTELGPLNQLAYHAMFTAGVATVLFNANPLMRFDGYYVLSDLLDVPNLAQNGQVFVRQIAGCVFLGEKFEPARRTGDRVALVRAYGVMALLWRVVVTFGLVLAAASLLPGVGLLLALVGAAAWYGYPALKLTRYLFENHPARRLQRRRFFFASGLVAATVLLAAGLIPGPSTAIAPVIIEYDPLQVVRAKTDGFVTELCVREGDTVEPGQRLLRLENPELTTRIAELRCRIEELRVKAQKHLLDENLSAHQTAINDRSAQQERLKRLEAEEASLEVRAEQAGNVLTGELQALEGSFAKRGQVLLSIGDTQRKKATALLRPEDSAAVQGVEGLPVVLRMRGQWSRAVHGELGRVAARASTRLQNEAFAATYGGELPIVEKQKQKRDDIATESTWVLAEPRVEVDIRLDPQTSATLMAGQRGQMRLAGPSQSLGAYLSQIVRNWTRDNTRFNHGL